MTIRTGVPGLRAWLLAAVSVVVVIAAFWLPPIPQDPGYHQFADSRSLLGLANFWNVTTNGAFLVVGVLGLSRLARLPARSMRTAYMVFCAGVSLVAFGSGWYHLAPSTPTLAWDRLPMTLAFMALFSLVIQDRLSPRAGSALLWPLLLAGVAAVVAWQWSEQLGQGDLRAYAIVQFLPMLLIPLMLLSWRGRGTEDRWLWATIVVYVVAKLAEMSDREVLAATGLVSGHSLKHLLAALAAWCAVLGLTPAGARD